MKIIFLGCTNFSKEMLEAVLSTPGVELTAIFSIPREFNISYSEAPVANTNYADLSVVADKLGVPFYEVDSLPGKKITDYKNIIQQLSPDLILVMGWYYMVPASIRSLARLGAWGIHASLLPEFAGGAPLVWAIIEGRKQTGVSLFQLEDGVDDGDILKQQSFPIEYEDTIKEVYEKATIASKQIIREALSNPGAITHVKQNKAEIKVYPQRGPQDGEINWEWDHERIRNFIRAQSKPYPGAWFIAGNKKVTVWNADISEMNVNTK